MKKIVLIPISMGWTGISSSMGDALLAINGLSQKKSTRNNFIERKKLPGGVSISIPVVAKCSNQNPEVS